MGNMNDNLDYDSHFWNAKLTRRAVLIGAASLVSVQYGTPIIRRILGWYAGGFRNEYEWDAVASPFSAEYRKANQGPSVQVSLRELMDAASQPEFDKGLADPDAMRSLLLKIHDGRLEERVDTIVVNRGRLGFRVTEKDGPVNFFYARIGPELRYRLAGF